LDAQDQLIPKI